MTPDFLSGSFTSLILAASVGFNPTKRPFFVSLVQFALFADAGRVSYSLSNRLPRLERTESLIRVVGCFPVMDLRWRFSLNQSAGCLNGPAETKKMLWEDGWKSNILSELAVPSDSTVRTLIGQRSGRSGPGGAAWLDIRASLVFALTSRGQLVTSQASVRKTSHSERNSYQNKFINRIKYVHIFVCLVFCLFWSGRGGRYFADATARPQTNSASWLTCIKYSTAIRFKKKI